MLNMPLDDQITLKWLFEKMPLSWWLYGISISLTAVSAAFGAGVKFSNSYDKDILDKLSIIDELKYEIATLESKKVNLDATITILKIKNEHLQLSDDQVRDKLKKWVNE